MLDAPTWTEATRPTDDQITLTDVRQFLQSSTWTIVISTVLFLLFGGLYVVATPASYLAIAQIMIEPNKEQLIWRDIGLRDLSLDNAQVESQIEVLKSERIGLAVIDSLHLMEDPEFGNKTVGSDFVRRRTALSLLVKHLNVRRVGESYLIEVSYYSPDPQKAALIANGIADAYMSDQIHAKSDAAHQASQWMEQTIVELGKQLNAAAKAVHQFKITNGIVDNPRAQPMELDQVAELEARVQAYRKLYETFLEKLTENIQQETFPVPEARIITAAVRPLAKTYPRTSLVMLLATLLGIMVGCATAFIRKVLDHRIRTAKEVHKVLGLSCLGTVPHQRKDRKDAVFAGHDEVVTMPFSPFTQALRNIKVSIDIACRAKPGLCIGILSLLSDEGKTTTAMSLAALFSISGSRTLLIDCDFRDTSISRTMAPTARIGLVEALSTNLNNVFCLDEKTNTHVLPLVNSNHVANSSDILGSHAMQALLRRLRESFDTIIIDLPALTRVPDGRAIGPLLDSCILVAEWGRAPLESLKDAVELLRTSQVELLGVVINKIEEGIPPLFGITFSDLCNLDWSGYADKVAALIPSRR